MSATNPSAFWSYVRNDDDAGVGAIVRLSEKLTAEYELITGEPLNLFVDRSIGWGDEWEKRIRSEVLGATFFIPIITPRYFASPACRDELLQFSNSTEGTPLESLLMPIYWVDVPGLEQSDSIEIEDPLIRTIKKRQWEDLREIRLSDESSAEYRQAVDRLARELARRVEELGAIPERQPTTRGDGGEETDSTADEPGFLEEMAQGEGAIERLTTTIQELGELIEVTTALAEASLDEFEKSESQNKGFAGRVRVVERYAKRLSEPAAEIAKKGNEFTAELQHADRFATVLLDEIEEGLPDSVQDEDNRDYLLSLVDLARNSQESTMNTIEMEQSANENAKLSRSLRGPTQDMTKGFRALIAGNDVIQRWGTRAASLLVSAQS